MSKKLFHSLLILGSVAFYSSCGSETSSETVTTYSTSEISPDPKCKDAPSSWFVSATTPSPDDYGPFVDSSTTSDCDFHLWSFQKFLSLTRSSGTKAPFQELLQVSNDLELLPSTVLSLTDITQAGTQGTLYDKNSHAIHYAIHVNKQMYEFQKMHLSKFEENINDLKKFGYDTLTYPVGCIEIKSSWILASSLNGDELKKYYVTKANLGAPQGEIANVDVALLGMHIVGRVVNHPELIWATFEHDYLAPDYNWSTGKDTTTKIVSDENFLFYNAKTPVDSCPMNNKQGSPAKFTNVFNMFKYGMAQSFTQNNLPSHKDSVNNANITALNASVKKQLQPLSGPWKNYFYKGATWIEDSTLPSFGPGKGYLGVLNNPFLRGSRAISNITMETFAQLNFSGIYATGSMNCFGCHGTVDYKNGKTQNDSVSYNLALSHLFINALLHKLHPSSPKTP